MIRKGRPYREPESLAGDVAKILKGLRPQPGSALESARGAWQEIVGPEAARRTRVISLVDGVLSVAVSSAAMKHDLSTFRQEEILGGLSRALPEARIRTVRYRTGR